jgi:hypothetical protein
MTQKVRLHAFLRIIEPSVEELFADLGYRCEEWLGVENSKARLGIFGAVESSGQKLVFCLEWSHNMLKSDLLLPVIEHNSASFLTSRVDGRAPQT